MKIYNLCSPIEHSLAKKEIGKTYYPFEIYDLEYYMTLYFNYFVNQEGRPHRLDGPAAHDFSSKEGSYFIDGASFSKKEYDNHSDVINYRYLKQHPELKAFV